MLKVRQMIPPVTTRAADGRVVQAWDYKQKRSLLIAFLHAECTECEAFFGRVVREAARLAELEATALVVLPAILRLAGRVETAAAEVEIRRAA